MMSRRLVIVADDLTGACDAAGTLTRYGPVPVAIDGKIPSGRMTAIDLDTRRLDAARARRRVARAVQSIEPDAVLYKKVDSQLRGNVVAELNGVLDVRPGPLLFVPALPEENRVAVAGMYRIEGRRISLRRSLAGLASRLQFADPTRLSQLVVDGSVVLTGDATSRRDLRRWAALLRSFRAPTAAGSAGLAAEVPHALGWRSLGTEARWRPARRTLVAIGSQDARARQQLRRLAEVRKRVIRHPLDGRQILSDLSQGLALVEGEAGALARTVGRLNPRGIDALVLCGGETARAVLTRSGATTLLVHAEVLPRIPLATIKGGSFQGKRVVTKAGSFGPPDALVRAVVALERGHA